MQLWEKRLKTAVLFFSYFVSVSTYDNDDGSKHTENIGLHTTRMVGLRRVNKCSSAWAGKATNFIVDSHESSLLFEISLCVCVCVCVCVRAMCPLDLHTPNKKQCSRQLQCEVPCSVGNVVNSSLFNSSWSSLSSTSHADFAGGVWPGGVWPWGGLAAGGVWPRGGVWLWGDRGHFGPAAIYCITTWCFALKGLRTIIHQ